MARTPSPAKIGLAVRRLRTEVGLTRAELADRAETADETVSRIERNRLVPSIDLVVAHATETLGVEVTRAGLRHLAGGAPDWKRWRLARAVRLAATRRRTHRRRSP